MLELTIKDPAEFTLKHIKIEDDGRFLTYLTVVEKTEEEYSGKIEPKQLAEIKKMLAKVKPLKQKPTPTGEYYELKIGRKKITFVRDGVHNELLKLVDYIEQIISTQLPR
jgi:hypothetical protein